MTDLRVRLSAHMVMPFNVGNENKWARDMEGMLREGSYHLIPLRYELFAEEMGRQEWVLDRWNSLCSELGIASDLSITWGNILRDSYR